MSTLPARKVFSFARMMVLAQRRHEARQAQAVFNAPAVAAAAPVSLRAELAQRTLDHLSATRRLLAVVQVGGQPA